MSPRTALSLATLAVLACAPAARAQARLTVLADSVWAGERVRVAVAVDHAAGRSAVFPDVPPGSPETGPLLSFGDAEALTVQRLPPRVRGAVRTDSAVYDVAVFAIDTARVGPVRVRLAQGRDTVDVPTGVALVPVRTSLRADDAGDPAPLGEPDAFPGLLPVWLALGALALAVVGVVAWLVVRTRRAARPAIPRADPFPEATSALDALGAAAPAEQTLGAREALRVYVARRLGLPALESTTDELDAALAADARVPAEARASARRALALADLVAFAGLAPAPDRAAAAVSDARAAVEGIESEVARSAAAQAALMDRTDSETTPQSTPTARTNVILSERSESKDL